MQKKDPFPTSIAQDGDVWIYEIISLAFCQNSNNFPHPSFDNHLVTNYAYNLGFFGRAYCIEKSRAKHCDGNFVIILVEI